MASYTFRESINALGWGRREPPNSAHAARRGDSNGFIANLRSSLPFRSYMGDGYTRLPTIEGQGPSISATTREEGEEGWLLLSRWDKLLIFAMCNLAALACFTICFAFIPVLSLRPSKFVILYVPCRDSETYSMCFTNLSLIF
jgi:hypothetical protein